MAQGCASVTQSYELAHAFIAALAGDPATAVIDWRALSDRDAGAEGHARRGTLAEWWPWLCEMNNAGYGIFCTIAAMDGAGRHLANVSYIRAHYIDLDNLSALQNYERATRWTPAPSFAVQSSPGKYHVYWPVEPYAGIDYFQLIQRKLRQLFDSDKAVIDAARVMRLPGTYHCKGEPHLVTCWSLPGYGQTVPVVALDAALVHVNVIEGGSGRHDLGDPTLAAPDIGWLFRSLELNDPNKLSRAEWLGFSAAFKQAGWTLSDDATLFAMWSDWCNRYAENDAAENAKLWQSIRSTELGWRSILSRVPSLQAMITLGGTDRTSQLPQAAATAEPGALAMPDTAAQGGPPPLDCNGEILTHVEQQTWFAGCVAIESIGEILTPSGRCMNAGRFNMAYGGKQFIWTSAGKLTDEPWKAATRSTLWRIPKVDHMRFLPEIPYGTEITDELGRVGVNVYRPANIRRLRGDAGPFLRHIAILLPNEADRSILLSYLAHNIKYPGYKIPWAPSIQSAEGAGKGVIKALMRHAMGKPYFYTPKASELAESGAKFNKWLRNRLFILVDEIKVDDKLELIEVLKPLISEEDTEVQAKGIDQDLEDNFSNWLFFTNWKNAIPVSKNARRFAIMFSPLQTIGDLIAAGMDDAYFTALYDWLKADGAAIVTQYLMDYPIERGAIPMRAPMTTSTSEALQLSRSPIERVIAEAVEDALPGFRGGWISAAGVAKRIKESGAVRGSVAPQTIETVVEAMGYVNCGRAPRPYFPEGTMRSTLFHRGGAGDVEQFAALQGW